MSPFAKLSPAGSAPAPTASAPAADTGRASGRKKGPWDWLPLAQWVPIRTLHERHRNRVRVHLLGLNARDRYLRFGYPANDEAIERYVAALDFDRDELFGIFNRQLQLIATSHVAYGGEVQGKHFAEFAVSVVGTARGRGLGARLFDHAVMHARNRGVDRMLIHALSENVAMLRIAHKAGAVVQRDGGESEAWLKLPPDSLGSHMEELVATQAAEINYGMKHQGHRLAQWQRRLTAVGTRWWSPTHRR